MVDLIVPNKAKKNELGSIICNNNHYWLKKKNDQFHVFLNFEGIKKISFLRLLWYLNFRYLQNCMHNLLMEYNFYQTGQKELWNSNKSIFWEFKHLFIALNWWFVLTLFYNESKFFVFIQHFLEL